MAIKEITNDQYITFLNNPEIGAEYRSRSREIKGIYAKDELMVYQNVEHVSDKVYAFYVSPIQQKSDGEFQVVSSISIIAKKEHPVTWITYPGAQQYAKWLGTSLPKVSQYEHALSYSDQKAVHTRSKKWLETANAYNSSPIESRPLVPLDATEGDFYYTQTIVDLSVVANGSDYDTTWPTASKANSAKGLYDIIGNAFELCEDENNTPWLFGGSCLSPEESLRKKSFPYNKERESWCDVGFRVLVNLYEDRIN